VVKYVSFTRWQSSEWPTGSLAITLGGRRSASHGHAEAAGLDCKRRLIAEGSCLPLSLLAPLLLLQLAGNATQESAS
jgi:hypothetical protein